MAAQHTAARADGLAERLNRLKKALARGLLGRVAYERYFLRRRLGYWPHLRHPRSLNEKVGHRKLFADMPWAATLADKYAVREVVARRVGPHLLNELYAVAASPAELDLAALPDAFIVKGTHGSGMRFQRLVPDKSALDPQAFSADVARILARRHGAASNEWWYAHIPPRVVVERILRDPPYPKPVDYRFFTFHGRVQLIRAHVLKDGVYSSTFYDRHWRWQDVRISMKPYLPAPPPPRLDELLATAERLAEGLDFVAVDLFYPQHERIVFGEFTLSPAAGAEPYQPRSFDFALGAYW
jgi:TupA-like ATPgrasp